MTVAVYNLDGSKRGSIAVARLASVNVREDLIRRAVVSESSKTRQRYGADTLAGKRSSAHYHGRRSVHFSMMNREMARMQRIHNQGALEFVARFVPQAKKGRTAHPPKVEKNFSKDMNQKEHMIALLSAIAAGTRNGLVEARGHKIGKMELPLVIADELESLKKAKDVSAFLKKMGLEDELVRVRQKKVRAGKGTARGRRYVRKKGPLIIVKEDRGIIKAARNIAGVDVATLNALNVSMVAPGGRPGRLLIFTESALKDVDKYG